MIGPPAGALVAGARRSAEEHHLPHQLLSAQQLREQFPAFHVSDSEVAVHEPRAGILYPERAVQTHLDLAARKGAELQFENQIFQWEPLHGGVRVSTANGIFTGRKLLLTLGPWLGSLTSGLNLPLRVERQVLFWFDPKERAELFAPERFPIFIWENEPGHYFYGFPDVGDGIKIAVHHQGETTSPDQVRREVSSREINQAMDLLRKHLPFAAGTLRSSTVCVYTNTPDEHFLLDYYPACPQTFIASPCSGHGFKFSPVIGEIAAAMLCGESLRYDLKLFRLPRLLRSPNAP
jgi:sarcosine oxidase